MAKERTMAWHFVRDDGVLLDGTRVEIGNKLVHAGELEMCFAGYHASIRAIDALKYAPGPLVCRVAIDGDTLHDRDKLVARERTAIWGYDATEILRLFARKCALEVIDLWNPSDSVRDYLTDDQLGKDAAWAAADAAEAAACAAARAATSDAAKMEAWARADAARAARAAADAARLPTATAWAAARDTATAAAWAAACAAAKDAARDAARAEARAEARAAHAALLESLLIAGAQDYGFEMM